jgi:hypothetical protein
MAIQKIAENGWAYLDGTNASGDRVLLGEEKTSWQVGAHFLGLQGEYETPKFLRVYWDPNQEAPLIRQAITANRYAFVGYIQLVELQFLGQSIPPYVFGGAFSSRAPYATTAPFQFVDFMGPADVLARKGPFNVINPFYAFNGLLRAPINTVPGFGAAGLPTGSLYFPSSLGGNQALGASLLGQINLPLFDQTDIESWLERAPIVGKGTMIKGKVATTPLYLLALELVTGNTELSDVDRDIKLEDITRARAVGKYLLLNIANSEHEEPVLCASINEDADSATVTVHLFDYETVAVIEQESTLRLFERCYDYFAESGIQIPTKARPKGKGQGGLVWNRFNLADQQLCLRMSYKTLAVGQLAHVPRYERYGWGLEPLSGISYSAEWRFDAETRSLVFNGLSAPQPIPAPAADDMRESIATYYSAVEHANARQLVDTSNFLLIDTPWITPTPEQRPLKRRRDPEDGDG